MLRSHFGASLIESVRLSQLHGLPHIVAGCISWLAARPTEIFNEMFLVRARSSKVSKGRQLVEENKNLWDGALSLTAQDVSSLLLLYLRELPHSLLLEEFHEDILEVEIGAHKLRDLPPRTSLICSAGACDAIQRMKEIIGKFPEEFYVRWRRSHARHFPLTLETVPECLEEFSDVSSFS